VRIGSVASAFVLTMGRYTLRQVDARAAGAAVPALLAGPGPGAQPGRAAPGYHLPTSLTTTRLVLDRYPAPLMRRFGIRIFRSSRATRVCSRAVTSYGIVQRTCRIFVARQERLKEHSCFRCLLSFVTSTVTAPGDGRLVCAFLLQRRAFHSTQPATGRLTTNRACYLPVAATGASASTQAVLRVERTEG